MCPVCLATMGLYAAGGVSAGGITTYLATRLLRRRGDQHAGDRLLGFEPASYAAVAQYGTNDAGHPKEGEKSDDKAHDRHA